MLDAARDIAWAGRRAEYVPKEAVPTIVAQFRACSRKGCKTVGSVVAAREYQAAFIRSRAAGGGLKPTERGALAGPVKTVNPVCVEQPHVAGGWHLGEQGSQSANVLGRMGGVVQQLPEGVTDVLVGGSAFRLDQVAFADDVQVGPPARQAEPLDLVLREGLPVARDELRLCALYHDRRGQALVMLRAELAGRPYVKAHVNARCRLRQDDRMVQWNVSS